MSILFIQLLWFSFSLIGVAAILISNIVFATRWQTLRQFIGFIDKTPPAITLLITLITGLVSLSPIVIVSYCFNFPIVVPLVSYLGAMFIALVVIYKHRLLLLTKIRQYESPTLGQLLLFILVLAPLIFDFIMSLRSGAPLYGDAPIQIAKIHFFLTNHVTLNDPYFSYNGVIDPRYSTNLLNAYQSMIAKFLGITAVRVWLYSYGFYRLVIWLSIFALAWTLFPKKYKPLSYVLLALSPILFSQLFINANLPDRIVFAWICLFIVGLRRWLEDRDYILLLVGSLMIATTHALFALIGLAYISLLVLSLSLFRRITKHDLYVFGLSFIILLMPVALNLYYPNHTNQDPTAYNPGLAPPPLKDYGPFHISMLPALDITTIIIYLTIFLCIVLADKSKSQLIKLTAYCLSIISLFIWFNYAYLALFGYGLLLYMCKSVKLKIAFVCLVLLYPLIIYNPLFWHIVKQDVPPWVIYRFSYFNVVGLLAPILGLAVFTIIPINRWFRHKPAYCLLASVVSLLILAYAVNNSSLHDSYISWRSVHNDNATQLNNLDLIQVLSPHLKNQVIFSNDTDLSTYIPDVVTSNVIDFLPQNEAPMSNIAARSRCAAILTGNLNYTDLAASKTTIILTDGSYTATVKNLSQHQHNIITVARDGENYLFAIKYGASPKNGTTSEACSLAYGQ